MNDQEYIQWMWTDTIKEVGKGLLIYGIVLAAYWLTIG